MIRHDPLIDETREIRRQISQKYENASQKLIAHCIQLQNKYSHILRFLSQDDELAPREHTSKP